MHITRYDVRLIGAAGSLLMAGIYYLIGLGVLNVGGTNTADTPDLFAFGVGAGTAFLIIGVLLAFTDQRWVWALVLMFELLVFAMYVAVSGTRVPSFETWGVTLRVIQLAVIACLTYLTVRAPAPHTTEIHT